MKKIILFATILSAVVLAEATQYSKLAVITAAKKAGKWDALKTFISTVGLEDEWQSCVYLSDDYPQFAEVTNVIVASGVATTQEIAAILSASKDPALPDDLLVRLYRSDMSNETGRAKWHGNVQSTTFDTNALVKIQVYADGYRYEQPFKIASAMSIDARISSAERRAREKEMKEKREAAAAKKKADRIAMLETNLVAETRMLMTQKHWPEELARLWLLNELNTLIGTNTVDAVVRPQ